MTAREQATGKIMKSNDEHFMMLMIKFDQMMIK
jgi:hypothetical protein